MQVSAISASHKAMAAGDEHSLLVKADGTVWSTQPCGGSSNVFEQATGVSDVVSVAASGNDKCSMALKADNTVWGRESCTRNFVQLSPTSQGDIIVFVTPTLM